MHYMRNRHGVVVNKICASCIHKHIDEKGKETQHICDAGEGFVNPKSCCSQWEMRPGLENAGKADGRVKRYDYIRHIIDNTPKGGQSIDLTKKLRAQYLETHYDIYEDDFDNSI